MLPEIIDPDGDAFSVALKNSQAPFISYSGNALVIADLSDEEVEAGDYEIEILLSDSTNERSYTVRIVVQPPFVMDTLIEPTDPPAEA